MPPRTHAPTAPATSVRTLWVRLADAATAITPHSMLALVNRVAIAARYAIRSIPTMILFQQGREVARISGALGAADIVRWVRTTAG